jgi:ketosteroid isomerase-like protein
MSGSRAEEMARRWVDLYNDGTPESYGSLKYLDLYADDVEWREMPHPLSPEGRSGDLASVRTYTEQNQIPFRNRRVHLHEVVAEGDRAALRYLWEAEVAIDGLPVARGGWVRAEIAQFITVADGKIVRSHEFAAMLPPV